MSCHITTPSSNRSAVMANRYFATLKDEKNVIYIYIYNNFYSSQVIKIGLLGFT